MIGLWLATSLAAATIVDRVAAVVNDDVLTLSEVYELGGEFIDQQCPTGEETCAVSIELEVLDALIRRALIRQELARLDMQITAADVDQAIDRTVRQYQLPDRAALRAEIEGSGQRWDQYREELFEFLRTNAFQARILAPRVSVNDDEVKDFYQRATRKVKKRVARVEGFGVPVPADITPDALAELTLSTSQLVDAINAEELAFDAAVEEHDGAGVSRMFADQEFDEGELIEQVDTLVFSAEAGIVQQPRRVGDVLFVVRVIAFEERSEVAPFEEVKDQLTDQLFQEKLQEAEEEWYQRARREAAVDVKLQIP